MPLVVRIWGRCRGEQEINSAFSLGSYGMLMNVTGLLYLVFAVVTFNFPSVSPVTAENMNYTSAAVGVSVIIAALTCFTTGQKAYTGPQQGSLLRSGLVVQRALRLSEETA